VEQFEAGYKGGEYEAVVNEDFREAQDVGIQGTPSFTTTNRGSWARSLWRPSSRFLAKEAFL